MTNLDRENFGTLYPAVGKRVFASISGPLSPAAGERVRVRGKDPHPIVTT
jgi:hypothetical protein